jgi:SNF2 family DNA or RNA helicase
MFTGTLLPYQNEAVDKMVERQKVLVAYDLGLGKTVLTIAALEQLRDEERLIGPVLVIALSSLKYQWEKEIHKFTDDLRVQVIDGTKNERAEQWDHGQTVGFDYVICNYEQIVNDWDIVKKHHYSALVMDEATAIKAFRSKRSRHVKELSKGIPIRFGLTGTPIENGKPEELYSIMQAIDPTVLGSRFDLFDQTFIVRNKWGAVERYRNLPKLHARLKDATVRKSQTDPDVAPYLPDTIHREPILVPLDRHGAQVYRKIATMLEDDLQETQGKFGSSFDVMAHYGYGSGFSPGDEAMGKIMAKVTALKMLADDPALLHKSAAKYDPMVRDEGSKFLAELLEEDERIDQTLTKAKAVKLPVLKSLVADHLDSDPEAKVVIFCSYVDMADTIRDTVETIGTSAVVYTGQMSAKEKEAAKVAFQTDPLVRVLVSTDAGGYGVDLPQANMLINYDLPWSAGLAIQRNGRIRRASSKWPSIVIQDLLISESIEERQYAMLQQKSAVAAAVVDGEGINEDGGVTMTVGALAQFLRETQP